jgi:uncharacterized protein (UPF0332 family)
MSHSFDPKDFLVFAETLLDSNLKEAHFRTAVSRAYYAAYLVAFRKAKYRYSAIWNTAFKEQEGYHVALQVTFSNAEQEEISAKLSGLLGERKAADYDLTEDIDFERAKDAIQLGKDLIKLIEDDP